MPEIIRKMQITRATSRDSLNRIIPRIATPTAPIPVQTAYPVPTGIFFSATDRRNTERLMLKAVHTLGQSLVKPCEYFRPIAHPVSNKPAITSTIHEAFWFNDLPRFRMLF